MIFSWHLFSRCVAIAVSLLSCCIATTAMAQGSQAPAAAEVPQQEPILPAYKELDATTGVWNDGQAALWDLNIFDYFHYFGPPERAKGHQPEQPIKFSHITHVQKNKMDCQYCHWSVGKSSYAAIPEVETCVGCHFASYEAQSMAINDPAQFSASIPGKEPWQQAEIRKIVEYFHKGEPIPWVKVHVMPAHVNFNHKRHVKAGINCQECHGQVPNMQVVERVSSMKMGWCVDCHRQQGTSIDCLTCHK
ncbi:MAG: cytochrome c3 family protein [Bdellovibrionota bacterium]|nr:MAG: cytochrome c3 family protein [Bdellovibrionota bacterium]